MLGEMTGMLSAGGARVRLQACLNNLVSIKDAFGNIVGVASLLKELQLCSGGRLLQVDEEVVQFKR